MHKLLNYPRNPVYPRWRGEHNHFWLALRLFYGLSPLARGTLRMHSLAILDKRFIPAGAGNTHLKLTPNVVKSVYPRWRGEHMTFVINPARNSGLSPLARGTLHKDVHRIFANRFIPAGAGNTVLIAYQFALQSVYPRWRGEHFRQQTFNCV